jgi:hypothetical protein
MLNHLKLAENGSKSEGCGIDISVVTEVFLVQSAYGTENF